MSTTTPGRTTRSATYEMRPSVRVPGDPPVWTGAGAVAELLRVARERGAGTVLAVDCYPGVDVALVGAMFADQQEQGPVRVVDLEDRAARTASDLDASLAEDLTQDRVFGFRNPRPIREFYRADALQEVADLLAEFREQPGPAGAVVVVVGWAASLVAPEGAVVVLADLPRWEIQQRFRRGAGNWRAENGDAPQLEKFKRGYFVEWRTADEHKRTLLRTADHLLDTTTEEVKLVEGSTFRTGLQHTTTRPFRVVPYFDPGPWGGTWMADNLGLEPIDGLNYAWGFDCVPEENSLLLEVGPPGAPVTVEVPSLDVVLLHPRELLGQDVWRRFGAEFPIRFDFLDTVGGGNLSLQVHPLTSYIRDTFGMEYTQDESYYLLEATDDAHVYLGLRDGVEVDDVVAALGAAQAGRKPFPAEQFVNVFPARRHDHFLIPAGTVHCSGAGSMVLEISATPYIFTFKLWDWGRVGLDGRPRPIHLEHGARNIVADRRTQWVRDNLVNDVRPVATGPGWVEERTGLHDLEFIETRRHWFHAPVDHDTAGTVHVLNLVEGDRVVVESPGGAFDPVTVNYAETFIVPAAVGAFRIRPDGDSERYATISASVRPSSGEVAPGGLR